MPLTANKDEEDKSCANALDRCVDNILLPGPLHHRLSVKHTDDAGTFCAAVLRDICEALSPIAQGLELVCVGENPRRRA